MTGLTSVGTDALAVENDTTIGGTLEVDGTITGDSVKAENGFTVDNYYSLTNQGLKIGGDLYITDTGLDANGNVITNVKDASNDDEAVNFGQLKEYAATNELVGDGEYGSDNYLVANTETQINMDLTEAVTELDKAIGNNRYTGTNILNANTDGKTYQNITSAVSTLDSSIGNLTMTSPQSYFTQNRTLTSVTIGLDELSKAIGPMDFDGKNFISNDANLSSAMVQLDSHLGLSLESIGFRKDDTGKITTRIDWTGFDNAGKTIVDTLRNLDTRIGDPKNLTGTYSASSLIDAVVDLDGRVTALEPASNTISEFSASNISTLNALSNMDMSTANTLASISPNALKAVANLSAENAVVSDSEPASDSIIDSEETRNPTKPGITTENGVTTVPNDVVVNGNTTLNGTLNVTENATFGKDVSVGGKLEVSGGASIDGGNFEMNGNRITGVGKGIDDTDAVNVSQLRDVETKVDNNTAAINTVGNQVNRLSNRIDKVGAGAAALAALHPLDFDPDDKLSFAAGYGNYAGENAVAVGAFYQPNEDTMFSVGGTFGNDENMVNAGVSFKLGQKSNVSRSRVSMAKELVSLRDEVAQLKALMAHAGILPSNGQFDTSALFPDVPENHWAYEYVHELGRLGILEGYADGNFEGDRMMTRYEMAAIVYRAMQKGVNIDSRMLKEFEPELKLIRVDVVARDDDGNPTIERVRVNEDTQQA